jgi:hypothetical protein
LNPFWPRTAVGVHRGQNGMAAPALPDRVAFKRPAQLLPRQETRRSAAATPPHAASRMPQVVGQPAAAGARFGGSRFAGPGLTAL